MNLQIFALIISSLVWITTETNLLQRDKERGKGKTIIDKKTRNYNIISIAIAFSIAPIISWMPIFIFSRIKTSIFFWTGIIVECLGFFLRHWVICVLGKYFRTTIEIEKDQKVIQKGPYKYIRHPSYSGIILYCLGYGLITKNWISLIIAISIPTISLLYRISIEEMALIKEIGNEYEVYMKKGLFS
jgi:protein-S-isoprenylcysteine O-methyltransferase Ste14